MTKNPYDVPLSDDEFVEIGELLAQIEEPYESMEADRMDGFLTALVLLPEPVSPSDWMPYVFDEEGRPEAVLKDETEQRRLEDLVYRRYRSIERTLEACEPLDPIIYDVEDERGRPVGGYEAIAALEPFAAGFLEAMNRWPGLRETENELVDSALLGILRHLPEDLAGDMQEVKNELEFESPLENLKQAIEDVAESAAEIAGVTRGFKPRETEKPRAAKRPARPIRGHGGHAGSGGRGPGFRGPRH
ncbi:YecA family protein [Sutterella sp.]|uniref:YecA/YgfB family protein n=1 Tax=Sutterella sp. TaxID=1981025 RepID=UPI0026DF67DC|nr:YecA family protein [Sutterella sp.]MDO5530403.1 YecA family protein [Sutterella sp.]